MSLTNRDYSDSQHTNNTTSLCPLLAATCKGVSSPILPDVALAPLCSNMSTILE